MRLVVALGGNALLRRDQPPTAENQLENIRRAAAQLARVAANHDLVLTHGNGPQVGLLALQAAAYVKVEAYPLDVMGAQTDGMIGYLLEQELANLLPATRAVTTLMTRVEVDPQDPAFQHPTKPIGPIYSKTESERIAADKGWVMAADGDAFRRVVASPQPLRVLGLQAIRWLLEHGALVIATDVAAVFLDWGQPTQRAIGKVTPQALAGHDFAAGSMGPKVEAARAFVRATGYRAVVGSLDRIKELIAGTAGTQVCTEAAGGAGRL